MNNTIFTLAALAGAAVVIWIAKTFLGTDKLALSVTLVIGFAYALGLAELIGFRRDTGALTQAIAQSGESDDLDTWLQGLPNALRNPVRAIIEGRSHALPQPVLTPYLVGLLVMLGLLGTFIGMVDTLGGAVEALNSGTDLDAIRGALASPIAGLAVAFGTSVAGIAASATLGLNSTLARRERAGGLSLTSQFGDRIFAQHNLHQQRQLAYQAVTAQTQTLPLLTEQLSLLAKQLSEQQERFCQQTREDLTTLGQQLREDGKALHTQLQNSSASVGENLQAISTQHLSQLSDNFLAGINPAVERSCQALLEATTATQQTLTQQSNEAIQSQRQQSAELGQELKSLSASLSQSLSTQSETTASALRTLSTEQLQASAEQTSKQLAELSSAVIQGNEAQLTQWTQALEKLELRAGDNFEQATKALSRELDALREAEQQREAATVAGLSQLQESAAEHLTQLGQGLEEPLRKLIATASETPQAAAEVIGKLRQEISNNIERDNQLLSERQQMLEQMQTLVASLNEQGQSQVQAMQDFAGSAQASLVDSSAQFSADVAEQSNTLRQISAHFADGAEQIDSLGHRFSEAVQVFNASNENLSEHLAQLQAALKDSTERSDEQMAYYVGQAREIIDQSMLAQRGVIDELRQLGAAPDLLLAEEG